MKGSDINDIKSILLQLSHHWFQLLNCVQWASHE